MVVGVRRGDGGKAFLSVTDEGIGIPAAQREMLFTPFFRGTNAQKNVPGAASMAGGLGLGLHIAREIVRRHGGASPSIRAKAAAPCSPSSCRWKRVPSRVLKNSLRVAALGRCVRRFGCSSVVLDGELPPRASLRTKIHSRGSVAVLQHPARVRCRRGRRRAGGGSGARRSRAPASSGRAVEARLQAALHRSRRSTSSSCSTRSSPLPAPRFAARLVGDVGAVVHAHGVDAGGHDDVERQPPRIEIEHQVGEEPEVERGDVGAVEGVLARLARSPPASRRARRARCGRRRSRAPATAPDARTGCAAPRDSCRRRASSSRPRRSRARSPDRAPARRAPRHAGAVAAGAAHRLQQRLGVARRRQRRQHQRAEARRRHHRQMIARRRENRPRPRTRARA